MAARNAILLARALVMPMLVAIAGRDWVMLPDSARGFLISSTAESTKPSTEATLASAAF
ncbi:hypothetical protein H8L47_01270 [Undibacterium sp. NL8W]|uniref:Secreted protein n=1 Tax=Undibacterium umbellatum TaxID=2762300 RepID=A0ABR6Z3I9_9BURK|nr:hypothetical protein [Undibacterium umbellatum]